MLVLTRRIGEEIVIAGGIRVVILSTRKDRVRLGIKAPRSVTVDRAEVHARRAEFTDAGDGSVAPHDSASRLQH
ncbi:MAG TPA: carbon storage regulator [Gemmataceae bacterium]|nr:carbon storage regulator [Gemmataceae bacterium]